ncbi:MAG: hypothetical protein M3348_13030 [Acidobacteriota bacterium]|nr:hypothetical protein [Acidobacteriota bacterium]
MTKIHSRKFVSLLMAAGFVVSVAGMEAPTTWRAEAKQRRAGRSDGRRWEYCFVAQTYELSGGGKSTGVVELCQVRGSGCKTVKVTAASKSEAMLKAVAGLGADGWEALGLFPSPLEEGREVFFFKRPAR